MSLTQEQFDAALRLAHAAGITPPPPLVLRDRVFRTGRQRLLFMDGHAFMEITNRRYHSRQRVPLGRVPDWYRYFAQ